ncbi:carbon-nitrogen hydrolase family protein [Aliiglaciecola sp. CAU 1673]|uniref:carbon-nitrogen hydrolase family protein n=1 Tax=Aliiglaciecola sp. CAU 1673 TaxID=3032595 RepID=UPI0023DCCFD0|nr:carbon-nitrogen hydrolase family protein [Aliiglaciecola sp. CAU 1673]MDF2179040.1 carbon-nitrogen hydrolase family protein [Aliiglaciecola sp. CAU 1673]
MDHIALAAMQLALPPGNNLSLLCAKARQAKARFPWLKMLVFSELCINGPATSHAVPFPSEAERQFQTLAKELKLWIVSGSEFELEDGKVFNTSSVIDDNGCLITRYRKLFPFLPYEQGVTPGEDFVVFDTPAGRFGLAICYDLWFPEVARALVSLGAEVLLYPTMTNTIDRAQELHMAYATAAMHQCYVVAVNGCGSHGNGQSIVVGPDGRCLHQAKEMEEIVPLELDLAWVRRSRVRGLDNLGQPLKSFRDTELNFPQYQGDKASLPGLADLGPLVVPD